MRFLTRSLTGLFLFALTLALLVAGGFSIFSAIEERRAAAGRPGMAQERVFAANVVALDYGTITPILTAYGELRATRQLELRAAVGGTIVELSPDFEEGAVVEAGTLLVRLDPAELQAARDSAVASRAEAEAALAQATRALDIARDDLTAATRQAELRRAALDRQLTLNERGLGKAVDTEAAELSLSSAEQAVLTKRSALSSAEANLDQATNSLRRAEIALAEAERKLAETEIRADFSGRLSQVSAVQGGLVSTNEMLGQLIDPTALEVAFRVSTAQFSRFTDATGTLVKAPVEVTLDAAGAELRAEARLERVGAAVDEGVAGRMLYARLLDGAAGLRPGDFVTVRLTEPALDNVAEVPAAAVDANSRVLVLGEEDRLRAHPVEVLRRQGDAILIRADLPAGTEIVAERTPLLGEGIKLRPMRPGAGAAASAEPEMIALEPDRRARLIAFVEGNTRMPAESKQRILAQLAEDMVPAEVVTRLEQRIGG